jgi:hypothetical protein
VNFLPKLKRKNLKAESFLFLIMLVSLVLVFFNFSPRIGRTGSGDNLEGYAWNSNLGWISFNCTNDDSCAGIDYGVSIEPSTMNFSGWAWSSNIGWITFESDQIPPDNNQATLDNCLNWCDHTNNCTACYDPANGDIWGWALATALGDEGWIRLHASGTPAYDGVTLNQSTGEFEGWAWNGNNDGTGIGWISFNCLETGNCGTSDYQVAVSNLYFPQAIDLAAPNWGGEDACSSEAKHAFLSWTFYDKDIDSVQTAYQVVISTDNSTTTGVVRDTGKISGAATQYYMATSSELAYDAPYYWFVRVWDDFGFESDWYQFDTVNGTSTHTLTDNIVRNSAIGNQYTFTTYSHEFPIVDFDWAPPDPIKDEDVVFTDDSYVCSIATPAAYFACTESACDWLWSATGLRSITSYTDSSTIMTFDYGNNSVTLEVTDSDGYTCSSTQPLFVDLYPDWREVKPEN